jgi:hypothetical protein
VTAPKVNYLLFFADDAGCGEIVSRWIRLLYLLNNHQLEGGGLSLRMKVAGSAEAARSSSGLEFTHI